MNDRISKDLSRRNFLSRGGKSLALLAAANVGVYVIGSVFKELDGSLVAGAKVCECICAKVNLSCGHTGPSTLPDSCFVTATTCSSISVGSCKGTSKIFSSCVPL